MSQITRTHNGYHLGDNLVHLHFLRKVAQANPDRQFVHAVQDTYFFQLRPVILDTPNIKLTEFPFTQGIDAWRGAEGFWYNHPDRFDFVKFHVEHWFPRLAKKMGVENPIKSGPDMLFDYPAIKWSNTKLEDFLPFEILVINSPPGSGQWESYNEYVLGDVACNLAKAGHKVISTAPIKHRQHNIPCTLDHLFSVTQIGFLSLRCHTILMVSTGPSWPTFNIWNRETVLNRIILIDRERVYLAPHTIHCTRIEEAEEILKESGLL